MTQIVVIIGVSGAGKTTVGCRLAAELGWPFHEGDDFHSPANLTKMSQGIPLTDGDRQPWLAAIRASIAAWLATDKSAVIACSALKQSYRDHLSQGRPQVQFVYLKADTETLRHRLSQRQDHFMGESLLESQLEALEEPQAAFWIDAQQPVEEIVQQIQRWMAGTGAELKD